MKRVEVTRPMWGLLYMQVCACKDAGDEEVLKEANLSNPCGTTNGWAKVWREVDAVGENENKAPIQCASHPDRVHLLINC